MIQLLSITIIFEFFLYLLKRLIELRKTLFVYFFIFFNLTSLGSDLSKTIMGYTCPSDEEDLFEFNTFNDVGEPDEEFKILSDGHLSVNIIEVMICIYD